MLIDCPLGLWHALGLIEDVAAATALGLESQTDLEGFGLPREHGANLGEITVTISMALLAGSEIDRLLEGSDPGRKGTGTPPLREESKTADAGGELRTESHAQAEASLWAIRQALTLIAMFISTSVHHGALPRDLVARRTQEWDGDHIEVVRYATKLVINTCDALLQRMPSSAHRKSREGGRDDKA